MTRTAPRSALLVLLGLLTAAPLPLLAQSPRTKASSDIGGQSPGVRRCSEWLFRLGSGAKMPADMPPMPHGCRLTRGQVASITRGTAIRTRRAVWHPTADAPVLPQPAGSAGRAHLLGLGSVLGLSLGAATYNLALPTSPRGGAALTLGGGVLGFGASLYLMRRAHEDDDIAMAVGSMAVLGAGAALNAAGEGVFLEEHLLLPAAIGGLVGGGAGLWLHDRYRPSMQRWWNTSSAAAWTGVLGSSWAAVATDSGALRTTIALASMAGGGAAAWHLGTHKSRAMAIGADIGGVIGFIVQLVVDEAGADASSAGARAVSVSALVGGGAALGALFGWAAEDPE